MNLQFVCEEKDYIYFWQERNGKTHILCIQLLTLVLVFLAYESTATVIKHLLGFEEALPFPWKSGILVLEKQRKCICFPTLCSQRIITSLLSPPLLAFCNWLVSLTRSSTFFCLLILDRLAHSMFDIILFLSSMTLMYRGSVSDPDISNLFNDLLFVVYCVRYYCF